jgi:hypothetical protein
MATTKVQLNHLKESTNTTGTSNQQTNLESGLTRQIGALDSKSDSKISGLDSKIRSLDSKFDLKTSNLDLKTGGLDSEIRILDSKFDLKISGLDLRISDLDSKIKALNSGFDSGSDEVESGRWLRPFLISFLVGFVSVILMSTMSYLLMIYSLWFTGLR